MFFIFLFIVMILFALGILLFLIASKVYLSIKKQSMRLDIESGMQLEMIKKMKKDLFDEKEKKNEQ